MTSVNLMDGKYVVIVKGAIDSLAPRCRYGNIEAGKKLAEELSGNALRILAVGYKELEQLPEEITQQALESELIFMGLVGMIDPPRPEVRVAVQTCRQAGIKPVMITGDHIATARVIAGELGILGENDEAVTGNELERMTDEELSARAEHIRYARVSPSDKIRIVRAWQAKGEIVMTDGVNDAPRSGRGHRLCNGNYGDGCCKRRRGHDAYRRQFRDDCRGGAGGPEYLRQYQKGSVVPARHKYRRDINRIFLYVDMEEEPASLNAAFMD